MTRPSRSDMLMEIADVVARRSTCSKLHVGAVLTREGRVLATGYNGAPTGMPHCDHTALHQRERWMAEYADRGEDIPLTLADSYHKLKVEGCKKAIHAEANAIAFAARWGVATQGATLYTTHSPCLSCAQLIVNAGITEVISGATYRDTSGVDLLTALGISYTHDDR